MSPGAISQNPKRQLGWIAIAQVAVLGTIVLLAAWWGRLLQQQANRIRELEAAADVQSSIDHWERVQRMVLWESVTFFLLIAGASGVVMWLYWREYRRARALQVFFGALTHELKTPLTSIRLQAESIAEETDLSSAKILARRLLEDAQKLEDQVDRTLELARVEGGGTLTRQTVELPALIKQWKDNEASLSSDGVAIDVDLGTDEPGLSRACPVWGDARAISIILRNLVENTRRHGQSGGQYIRVRIARTTGSAAPGSPSGMTTLEFSDRGGGVTGDPKSLGELFERGPRSKGAGVGLYLVRALMARMDGSVSFENVGGGLLVRLMFRSAEGASR